MRYNEGCAYIIQGANKQSLPLAYFVVTKLQAR